MRALLVSFFRLCTSEKNARFKPYLETSKSRLLAHSKWIQTASITVINWSLQQSKCTKNPPHARGFMKKSKLGWGLMIVCTIDLAKRDLWGLGAESWFVVASYAFAKMISLCFTPQKSNILIEDLKAKLVNRSNQLPRLISKENHLLREEDFFWEERSV